MQNENENADVIKHQMTRIHYTRALTLFSPLLLDLTFCLMNNTILSARKEGRHDNDGAQTEVAVVMTELRATAVYPQTANCNTDTANNGERR